MSGRGALRLGLAAAGLAALVASRVTAETVMEPPLPEFIGVAAMAADGTITLHLDAYGPSGIRGHMIVAYPPSSVDYSDILAHIGPLKPGGTAAVRPWPDVTPKNHGLQ